MTWRLTSPLSGFNEPVAGAVAVTLAVTTSAGLVVNATYAVGNTIPDAGTVTLPWASIEPLIATSTLG